MVKILVVRVTFLSVENMLNRSSFSIFDIYIASNLYLLSQQGKQRKISDK